MSVQGLEAIVRSGHLPSPPLVALRVIELCDDPNAAMNDLAEVIEQDSALTAKLLRTANSPMFAASSRVVNLDRALVMLGLVHSRLLVLTFSLVDHYRSEQCVGFDYGHYWRRSALCSAIAKQVAASHVPLMEDYALVSGLLADVGKLVLAECECDRYSKVCGLHERSGEPIHLLEEEMLGADHAEVGSYLLTRWNLPLTITTAVKHHHDPAGLPDSHEVLLPLVRIIQFSEALADVAVQTDPAPDPVQVAAMACEYFDMGRDRLDALMAETAGRAEEVASFLSLGDSPELSPADLLAQARDLIFSVAWDTPGEMGQPKVG